MEIGRNMLMGNRGQTSNSNINLAWDMRELNPTTSSTRFDWGNTNNNSTNNTFNFYASTISTNNSSATGGAETTNNSTYSSTLPEAIHAHELVFLPLNHLNQQSSLYTGSDGCAMHPADPHLVCLKLGKRQYFEDSTALSAPHLPAGTGMFTSKKGKPYYYNLGNSGDVTVGMERSSSAAAMGGTATSVPKCQVEGCYVGLVNAKEYHRRHKVCEMHSKAPKVVVLGLEQRFCQQCSRFHVVSEFDDSKRSCRRRLAGHNERRRKSSNHLASRSSAQGGRFPYISSRTGRAFSLLSSRADNWISPSDLSSRSSAALSELIAENRAAILAKQFILDRGGHLHHHALMEGLGDNQSQPAGSSFIAVQQHSSLSKPHGWDRVHNETNAQVTLNLMQVSNSAFEMFSVRRKTKEEECSELWNSLGGTHVV